MRRNNRGTGSRTARKRDARATFPHPQSQVVWPDQGRELYIGALREKRVMFIPWAQS
jgi:hypothetical protein